MKTWSVALCAGLVIGGATMVQAQPSQNPISVIGKAEGREFVALRLHTADLDLNKPEDVIALRRRASRNIAETCNPGERLNADLSPDWQCRRELSASLESALRRVSLGG